MREKLSWLPQQYMLDTVSENPRLAKVHEAGEMCAVLFGHSLFIGGRYDREAAHFLTEHMLTENVTFAFCPDEEWKAGLRELLGDLKEYKREMYAIKPYRSQGGNAIIERMDASTLARYQNAGIFTEEVLDTCTYDSMDDFFARGMGFAPVVEGKIRGFITSEYPSAGTCAIGIMVEEELRGRGLAKDMTRAFLSAACDKGITTVYWECWKNNTPSVKTALACGFQKVAEYETLEIWR